MTKLMLTLDFGRLMQRLDYCHAVLATLRTVALAVMAVILVSCSKDNAPYPSLLSEFADVVITPEGIIESFTKDDGVTYDIHSQGLKVDVQDTIVRCLVAYSLAAAQDGSSASAKLHGLDPVYCFPALPVDSFETVEHAPVKVVSAWHAGRYINMTLGIMTTGVEKTHAFAFCQDSAGHFSLYHRRAPKDEESYTRRIYMSLPIYNNMYVHDSLTLSIMTYDGLFELTVKK